MEIFNNALFDIVVTAIVFLFIGGGVILYTQKRKQNPDSTAITTLLETLNALRPQILEVIADVTTAYHAAEAGYEAMEAFVIGQVYDEIQELEFLSAGEKALITKDLLIAFLRPELTKLYNQKVIEDKTDK